MQQIAFEECHYRTLKLKCPKIREQEEEDGNYHKIKGRREWHETETMPKDRGQQRIVEECRHWMREHRTVAEPNERPLRSAESLQPTQLPAPANPKKYVPLEFRAIRPPSRLITGNDLKKSDRSDADNFEGEIFNAASGWFRIRVKAVGFEPDDFKLSIDFSEFVLGVDATHEQQTRDGLSMASEVDLCSLRAFLTSDGHFLEITAKKAQNEAQRQKNWGSNELKKTQQKERHFDRWTMPYSAKTKIELGRAENEMGEQRALRRKNIIDD
ncbi:hypothetical protein niasHS_003752 [Heterodera schachtii]